MYFMRNLIINQKEETRQSSERRWRVGLVERHQRVASEVLLAPVDSRRDDPEKLPVEISLHRQALVRSQNADLVDFAGFQEGRVVEWIISRHVSNVAVKRCVLVFDVPHGATVVEVVGEHDSDITVESDAVSWLRLRFWLWGWTRAWAWYAPPSASSAPTIDLTRNLSHFCMQCAAIFCALPTMWNSCDGDRLINRQEADVAFFQKHRIHDVLVRRVDVGNRRRIALDVRHHQAPNTRELRERHCLSCVCVHCVFLLSRYCLTASSHNDLITCYPSIIAVLRQGQQKIRSTAVSSFSTSRIKNFSSPKIKIWFELMFLTSSFAVLSGAAPPPFRIFAGGFFRKSAFGLIQEYCTR